MLNVTLDLITKTASSSLFAFCFCNLIIVIILVGSKPSSVFEQEESHTTPLPVASTTSTNDKETVVDSKDECCEENKELVVAKEVPNAQKVVCDDNNDEEVPNAQKVVCDDNNDDDNIEEEEGDDDELRKRVEEFIDKVNRRWKAELLKSSESV